MGLRRQYQAGGIFTPYRMKLSHALTVDAGGRTDERARGLVVRDRPAAHQVTMSR